MNNIFSKGYLTFSSTSQCKTLLNLTFTQRIRYYKIFPVMANCTGIALLHTFTTPPNQPTAEAPERPKRIYKKPVDWLPFQWHRRPMNNHFAQSGDFVQTLEYDPSWPKPDFELSEELKTATKDVKHIFSLATGSKADIKEVIKRNMLKKVQRHPNDFDSLEVKIALRTLKIRSAFDHGREVKKDIRGSRILLHIQILRRRKLLKQLYRTDSERFDWLTKELQVYYTPEILGGRREMYCKKWDLRRLTKEYCEKTVKDKKEAYQEELKKQQADFLKEKEETLAWIEKEEKELANLTV